MKGSLLRGNTLLPQGRALKLRSGGQTSVEVIFYSVQRLYRGRESLVWRDERPSSPRKYPFPAGRALKLRSEGPLRWNWFFPPSRGSIAGGRALVGRSHGNPYGAAILPDL